MADQDLDNEGTFTKTDDYGTHTYDKAQRVYLARCAGTGQIVRQKGSQPTVSPTGHHVHQLGHEETRVKFTPDPDGKKIVYGPNVRVGHGKKQITISSIEQIDADLRPFAIELDADGKRVKKPVATATPATAAPATAAAPPATATFILDASGNPVAKVG